MLNIEIQNIIKNCNTHNDLVFKWYLPETVISERQFQMRKKGLELLPSIHKLENLLGHNLNITADIINTRVNDVINKNIEEYKLNRIKLNLADIDWQNIIDRSHNRTPPFENGEKEKGFRDALIAESFYQLLKNSPSTPHICRVIMVTEDNLLFKTIKTDTESNSNVRVLKTLEELKGLINTLVSKSDEEFINKIIDKARKYFFQENDNSTYYFKADIKTKISNKFQKQLERIPPNSEIRENNNWYISNPNFVKKNGQRVFLSTKINVESTGFKYINKSPLDTQSPSPFPMQMQSWITNLLTRTRVKVISGTTEFEVVWSISVSATKLLLSKPKIEEINFVEFKWDDA